MKSKLKDIGFFIGMFILIIIFDIARGVKAINKILRGDNRETENI